MFSLLQEAATTAVGQSDGAVVVDDTATSNVVVTGTEGVRPGVGQDVEAVGLPQLDMTTFGNQIFWLVVTLVVLYLVLSRVALPRIAAVLSDRQGAVTGDLMAAEEFKLKAREAEAAYDKALADARTEAQGIVAQNRATIQGQLDAAIAKADAEIAARTAESETRIREIRVSADASAREVARDVTAELVRSFGGQADDAAISSALDGRMKGAVQ
ncbi:F0F1 ATP synthase subunit B' [Paracoccus liaowanqingii]|uniref:ATP synthase subunit b n=1 Tax=Paracoccus liaowanqingii TaxID=2560053 RepID=A0A4P7HLY0_9RHOB|nr:F0F1 ATP synthase subunit B' [Paracoccus liaowanqingii]QBX34690.1 F0F1 ATP synthase subunit B' [Paracoccus liaowanqingii]TGN48890.1 F0F1 ATP synthase subunit B' [Paracoccus liaowanqingii]